jgi:hypothetical protein
VGVVLEGHRHFLGGDQRLGVRAAVHPAAGPLGQQAVGLELAAELYRPGAGPSAA